VCDDLLLGLMIRKGCLHGQALLGTMPAGGMGCRLVARNNSEFPDSFRAIRSHPDPRPIEGL
jgi:hypothetical protein